MHSKIINYPIAPQSRPRMPYRYLPLHLHPLDVISIVLYLIIILTGQYRFFKIEYSLVKILPQLV